MNVDPLLSALSDIETAHYERGNPDAPLFTVENVTEAIRKVRPDTRFLPHDEFEEFCRQALCEWFVRVHGLSPVEAYTSADKVI